MSKPAWEVGDKTVVHMEYNGWAAGEPVVVVGVRFTEYEDAYRGSTNRRTESVRIKQDTDAPNFEFDIDPRWLLPKKQ